MVKSNEKKIERFIGPTIIQTVGPVIFAAAGGTSTVRLNKYFNLQLSIQKNTLIFSKEF